ncbi:arg8-vasotocin receptor-like [Alligator sinensis]|uniref:Arg8-vasotocin receptor-like n=1 Tax=Alligator sinensis TaxID=38654 RepID=A0A1U7RN97_ALLSI|nr:arg8-vasotocin receptor-like [Alligator sinensis]
MKNFSFSMQDNTYQTESPFPRRFLSMTNKSDPVGRPERDEQLAQVEIAVLGVIFITASVGNFILILVLWRRRKKLSRMYVFMLHLSIADLVVAFFQVLPQLIWDITDVFIGPDVLCRTIKYLQLVGMFASTYMIVVMTVDRYQAVCYPMVTFQKKRALWNAPICTSWSVSLLFSLPQVFIFSKTEISPGIFECWGKFIQPWGSRAYVTWIFVAIFFIPTAILIICQVKICKIIHKNIHVKKQNEFEITNQKQTLSSRTSSINCISKAMIKTVKMTVVTVVAYVLCWAPFFIAQLWSVWFPSGVTEGPVFTIIMLLGNLNSCANPWIYMYFCGHIPYCANKQLENISAQEESVITGIINLGDKEPEENITSA